jgi:ribosomal protein S18 acetylase RimI-like enzyme
MTKEDLGQLIEIDKKITGRERTPTWPQKVSSHFETYDLSLCFVAEVEGSIRGFILGNIRGAEYGLPLGGWIDIMGIDPEYQGKGIGRMLANAFTEECQLRGIKARVMVRESDERLQKFLLRLGFKRGELINFDK